MSKTNHYLSNLSTNPIFMALMNANASFVFRPVKNNLHYYFLLVERAKRNKLASEDPSVRI